MANTLKMDKQLLIGQLLELGWSYRRIEEETGIRRETVSKYDLKHPRHSDKAKAAKVPADSPADDIENRPKCPPSDDFSEDANTDLISPVDSDKPTLSVMGWKNSPGNRHRHLGHPEWLYWSLPLHI